MKYLLASLLFFVSSVALAQEAVHPDPRPVQPCTRGATTAKLAGLDIDIAKCQLLVMTQKLGELQAELATVQAQTLIAADDHRKQTESLETQKATLIEWLKQAQKAP